MGQNLTIYRMTAANVTGLGNKNTGNPSGDTIFNMESGGRLLTPIKQFFRPTIGPVKSDDESLKINAGSISAGHAQEEHLALQGSTVTATGGGRVWVLVGKPLLNASVVEVVGASGQVVTAARIDSAYGNLKLVSVPSGLPPAAYRLSFSVQDTANNSSSTISTKIISRPVNAPEPHWVTPRGRVGDVLAVYGRRLRREGSSAVSLVEATNLHLQLPKIRVVVFVENENRATFVLPSLTPGSYKVQYSDDWGEWDLPESLTVLAPKPVAHRMVNASLPPFSADASGKVDASGAIVAALKAAGSGGTVTLGAGVFLLVPNRTTEHSGCHAMDAVICLPPSKGALPVTLQGLGAGITTLQQGATAQISFWGSAVSLSDLTLTDKLPEGQEPAIPAGTYQARSLWSFNTYAAWAFNTTDVSFHNVHFIASRNHSNALHLRYIRTVVIFNCTFDYTGVQLSGPLLDVQLLQSRARLQAQWSTGFIQNGVGGRISSTVVANTTVTGLVPQEQSTIAGRFHQAQGYWEYFYVAGNVNERASPGDLHHDINQGEQFCWESGDAENDARARVVRANHAQPSITVDTLPANTLTALLVQQGGIESGAKQVWDKRYGTGSGGVAVISGTGAGQVRRMLDIMPDNRTLLLDQAFSISPDETSVVSVFLTWVYSAIIRDNRFVGARKQVDQEPHTAACMIPLWGRASTVDFINNHARDIRGTMYLEVNPNLTVTDHIIRDTFSNYTRYGIRMQNEPYKGQLSLIVNIENYTLHNVVEYGHKAIAACRPGQYPGHYPGKPGQYSDTCTGDRAGGVAISGLKVVNATTAFLVEPNNPGHDIPGIIPPASNPEFEGNGLAVYSLQQFSFSGGGVGAQIAGSLANETFADGHIDGFDINVNCSDGVNCSLLTRSLLPPVDGPRSTPCGSDVPVVTVALDDVEANRSFWVFGHAFAVGGKPIDGKSPIFNVQQLSSGQEQQAEILSLIVNTTDCSSSALLVLPTFTTSGHTGGPYSLVVKTLAGASSSTLLGAATVDWASPFTVNLKAGDSRYNGCAHAVYGRSLTTFETPAVELKNKTDTVVTCTVLERTESRVCFACQDIVTPGTYTVTLCGHAGGRRLCTDGKATTESISDPEAQHKRRVINASQVKYNLDPHGTKDATLGLRQALVDATNDGREPGGLVVLGPGTFLLDPHSHPSPRLDNCAICRLGATHSVHLVGAGINNTTLLVGPNTDAAFAAAQVGLENLTVADTPAADGTVNGFAVNGSSIRALWTMTKLTVIPPGEKTPASSTDSIEMAKYEGADIRFKNVRFLSHRVGCGLAIRYMKRVQVDSCVFEGGNINVWGPVIDVRLTNNIALMNCDGAGHSSKLYNSSGLGCGGFIDALGWGGAGHASDLVIANNSVWHLLPKEKSRFPGRFFVGQNRFLRRLYIAGNTNHMAGPGALSDQNKGEQVLLEVVGADASTRVVASSGTQLTLDETHSTVLDEYRNRVGLLNDGTTSALGWQYFAGIGTVHVSAGRGVGQWRTVLNIFGNNTIQLDKPFTVSPNRDSRIVLAGSSAHNIIVRDNFFSGEFAKEHVTDVPHVATAAVFMWGNTQRYTAVNNTANWIRTTIDLFAYGNTSQADVLIKDTLSTGATRSLIQANFALQSAVTGQTVRHVQAKQAYFAGMEFHPNQNCHEPCHEPPVKMNSGHGLGISFEDIAVGATPFGITMGSKPQRAPVDGTMLQAFVRNSSFYGSTRTIDGNWTWGEPVGIWHNLSFAAGLHFDGLQLHNFQQNLAGSLPVSSSIHILGLLKLQTEVSSTLDEAAFGDSIVQGHCTWKLKVENMGLLDANVTVSGLPPAAKVMAPTAQLAAFGGAATFGIVVTKPATACGKVCADDSSNCLPFCVEAGAEAGSNHLKLKTDDTVHPPPPPPPPPPLRLCPCNDTSLCQSLPPMKQRPHGDEVIAFSSWEFSGEQPYGSWTAPRHFDWDKITVFAPFDDIDRDKVQYPHFEAEYQQMWCQAHSHGARILTNGFTNWAGRKCAVNQNYEWALKHDPLMYNQSAVRAWAAEVAACVALSGFDGVIQDMEGIVGPPFGPTKEKAAITFAVCELKRALNATVPGSWQAWTTDTGAYFDYATMTEEGCIDLWLDIAYSLAVSTEQHSLGRHRAQAPLPFLVGPHSVTEKYTTKFGVPLERLGILLPWYGSAFECAGAGVGKIEVSYHGCPQTPGKMQAVRYKDIVSNYLPNASAPPFLNTTVVSKVLNFLDGSGKINQLWYDDAETYAIKYAAVKKAGVRGIGMWTADCAGNNVSVAASLWTSVPAPKLEVNAAVLSTVLKLDDESRLQNSWFNRDEFRPDSTRPAACNLQGNWTGPATSVSGLQITIVQQGLDTNFSFYYSEKGWVAGTIVGKNVTIPGHIGTVGKSPYPDLGTGARAPPCTKLTFAGLASRFWCKYPFCPHAMPPQPAPPSPKDAVPLTLLPQDAGPESPANLDGSPYGVYYAKSRSGKSTKWTVSIEGGGWCYNEAECLSRSKGALGTSKVWPKALPFSLDPYGIHFKIWEMGCMNALGDSLDMDCNSIYLPYGDGASFSGFRGKTWPVSGTPGANLTFRGIKNLDAAIEFAMAHGMSEATELVVTGVSAGGLSTFLHTDRIAARVRRDSPNVTVKAAPVVGFFLDHANHKNEKATSYTTRMAYAYKMQNLTFGPDGGLTPACAAAFPTTPAKCFMSPHMFPYIQTPLFVFNSRFDAWQLANILQISSWSTAAEQRAVVKYGASFLQQFAPLQAVERHGGFITTCICHACHWSTLVLQGKTAFEHYAAWYQGKTTGAASVHVDTRMPNGNGTITDSQCSKFPVALKTDESLQFAVPTRVYGNGTSRSYGGVYADAFYTLVADGKSSVYFGVPGDLSSQRLSTPVLLSEYGGESWRPWYSGRYVSLRSGYPFIAVRFNSSALHDLGSACASIKNAPESSFHANSIDIWHKHGTVQHSSEPATVTFDSLPVPLNCTEGGVSADCFWLHAGGTAPAAGGGMVLTSAIPWLNGRFGATKKNAGVYAWHSNDGLHWKFRGTLATAEQFPSSGEGPNENDIVRLSDGKTLLAVFRIDDGVDGGKVGAKNYRSVTSTNDGASWSRPREMNDTTGRGMGVARPRMLMLGNGKGPLLLSGGRLYTEQTRDILLWVSWDGMGENWETYSLSYHHNSLVKRALRFSAAVNSTSGRATTSYTSLLALDSDNAVVVYNGETGIFAMRVTVSGNMPEKKLTQQLDVSPN